MYFLTLPVYAVYGRLHAYISGVFRFLPLFIASGHAYISTLQPPGCYAGNKCLRGVIRCNFGRLRVVRFRHSENARVALITVSSGMEVDVARQPDGA